MSFYDDVEYDVEDMSPDDIVQNVVSVHVCPQCGAKMRPYEQYCHRCCSWIGCNCPHCHMPISDEKVCVHCGHVLRQEVSVKHTLILAAAVCAVVGTVCVGYILSVPHFATADNSVDESVTFVYDDPDSLVHVDATVFDEGSDEYVRRASADKPMSELVKTLKAENIEAAATGSVSKSDVKGVDNYFVAIKDDEALFEPTAKAIAKFCRDGNLPHESFNITVIVTKEIPMADVQERMNTTLTMVVPDKDFPKPEYGHATTSYRMYLEDDEMNKHKLDERLLELFQRAHKQIN